MLETKARKGLNAISKGRNTSDAGLTYKKETRAESVEIEDTLKAGHCVEPERGMQLCAEVKGIDDATIVRASTILLDFLCFLFTLRPPASLVTPSSIGRQLPLEVHFF